MMSMPWVERLLSMTSVGALRLQLAEAHPRLADLPRRLAIVGAASAGRRLMAECAASGIEVLGIADDSPQLQAETVGGIPVVPVDALASSVGHDIPVIIASHRLMAATARLQGLGFTFISPIAALQVLHPTVFGPHMFYTELLESLFTHRNRVLALAHRLGDERSRRVLDAVVGFRQMLQVDVLAPVVEDDLYLPAGLFAYGTDEVYVDGGAFDGDSIRMFIARTGGQFSRILGFEPDPVSFARLERNFADEPRVQLIQAGLFDHNGELRFRDDGARDSSLQTDGATAVPVTYLDGVLAGSRATFIKLNIEGAELKALVGAAETIRRWRPRMAVSAYHHPADLWELPEAIDKSHRLFLRQHDGGIIETVLYALP